MHDYGRSLQTAPARTLRCPGSASTRETDGPGRRGALTLAARVTLGSSGRSPPHLRTPKRVWRARGEKGTLAHYCWECNLARPLCKTVWTFLKSSRLQLPSKAPSGDLPPGLENPYVHCSVLHGGQGLGITECPPTGDWIRRCGAFAQGGAARPWEEVKYCDTICSDMDGCRDYHAN